MPQAIPNHVQHSPADLRLEPRTHLFVLATLYSGDTCSPVHMRNMSPTGALIEGSELPDVGTSVRLRRGCLQVSGQIAWLAGRKAGVAFASDVYVSDWMARQANPQQQIVDDMVRGVRLGTALKLAAESERRHSPATPAHEELLALKAELAGLAASLVEDVILVVTHPEIQVLDVSLQRIDRLLSQLAEY